MSTRTFSLALLALLVLATTGCKESNPNAPNTVDHDIVTTVTMVLKPVGSLIDSLVVVWEDIDGPGGSGPNRIDTLVLQAGVSYVGSLLLENRSVLPVVNITNEINAEKDHHQFFFTVSDALGAVSVIDMDSRSLPVGLSFQLSATNSPTVALGSLRVQLSHWENSAEKDGTTPSAETDVSVTFPLSVLD